MPTPTATSLKAPIEASERSSEWKTRIAKVQVVNAAKETGEACLVLIYPPGADMGKRFPLTSNEIVLGRGAECDIQVDRDSVSRRHARVYRSGDNWSVEDLQSTNGSYVNDVPVTKSVLRDSDFLKIGAAIFKFLTGSGIEASYHEAIYKMTIVDALTGAHNQRYFIEFLEREIARCVHYRRPLSLLRFDIDDLKAINERHGHLAGDHVLREVSQRLLGSFRKEELLARVGGAEFAAVLPELDVSAAREFAQRVRQLATAEPISFERDRFSVSISTGIATLDGEDEVDVAVFVETAEANLQRASREGRNRVVAGANPASPWRSDPGFALQIRAGSSLAALALIGRDLLLARGGSARVDALEGLLFAHLKASNAELALGALEGGGKLLVALMGRDSERRLRILLAEATRRCAAENSDARFIIGPIQTAKSASDVVTDAITGLDDELAIVEHGRYLPQPIAVALRALDAAPAAQARAKLVVELGEAVLQWLALCLAAELVQHTSATRTAAAIRRNLSGLVTMGRWHEVFACATKELGEAEATHASTWNSAFSDRASRAALLEWFNSLVESRNAFAHGATAGDEHVSRRITDDLEPKLRMLITHDLRPALTLIPADIEIVGFEGELMSYRMTRLIGDGMPTPIPFYSRRRMNAGLWLCDPFVDRALALEPFFVRDTCPKCGARELFLLNRVDEFEYRNPANGHTVRHVPTTVRHALEEWLTPS